MFFDTYTYKNYTDAITWPFIRLTNACQCKLPVTYNLIAKRGVRHSIIKTDSVHGFTNFIKKSTDLRATSNCYVCLF